MKKQKGITLIALVITIIVLLILAGVAISQITGNSSILEKANQAKIKDTQSKAKEMVSLMLTEWKMMYMENNSPVLDDFLKNNEYNSKRQGYSVIGVDGPENNRYIATVDVGGQQCEVTINAEDVENPYIEDMDIIENGEEKVITVTLSESTLSLTVGETETLTATVLPANASNKNVTWASDNPSVATVSNGTVTAAGAGTAHITATSAADDTKKGSCTVTVTAQEVTPVASIGNSTHQASTTPLSYTWAEINEIAKAISLNYETAEGAAKITKATEEVTVSIPSLSETPYTVGIGDKMTIGSNTVRIIGFNHDKLASTSAYGDNQTHHYAGITFEFQDILTIGKIRNSNTNSNGWVAKNESDELTSLYANLNINTNYDYHYSKLPIKDTNNNTYIKQVTKTYITNYSTGATSTSDDFLWLLACSEIWSSGYQANKYGYAAANESTLYTTSDTQTQYKYYEKGTQIYNQSSDYVIKKFQNETMRWWLRSPTYDFNYRFLKVGIQGLCGDPGYGDATQEHGIAPGFCI